MKGQVLNFSVQESKGVITTEDGKRYDFKSAEWKEATPPSRGLIVDFDIGSDGTAIAVYKALEADSQFGVENKQNGKQKNRILAGLLALFLGNFGAHKFYLGLVSSGLVYIGVTILTIILAAAADEEGILGIMYIISLFSLIDAIIYFTKSNEEFNKIYVQGKRQWF